MVKYEPAVKALYQSKSEVASTSMMYVQVLVLTSTSLFSCDMLYLRFAFSFHPERKGRPAITAGSHIADHDRFSKVTMDVYVNTVCIV